MKKDEGLLGATIKTVEDCYELDQLCDDHLPERIRIQNITLHEKALGDGQYELEGVTVDGQCHHEIEQCDGCAYAKALAELDDRLDHLGYRRATERRSAGRPTLSYTLVDEKQSR